LPIVRIPELATDVRDISLLSNLADMLVAGGV
jgi:hypothetical protein